MGIKRAAATWIKRNELGAAATAAFLRWLDLRGETQKNDMSRWESLYSTFLREPTR